MNDLNTEEREALAAIRREVDYWMNTDLEASFIDRVEGIKRACQWRENYVRGAGTILNG